MKTVISPKKDFSPEQKLENPEDDFLNTEGKIISLILCQKIIDSGQASRQLFMRMESLALILAIAFSTASLPSWSLQPKWHL